MIYKDYEILLEKYDITPNFWISEEYFNFSGQRIVESPGGNFVGIEDSEGCFMFPLIDLAKEGLLYLGKAMWGDFDEMNWEGIEEYREFRDNEYIYDPKNFLDLSGSKFKVFRKNTRRFEKEYKDWEYNIEFDRDELKICFGGWLKPEEEVYDLEVIMKYIEHGKNIKVLRVEGEVVGFNIWDENCKYINFRYCFDNREVIYCNEYLRLLFYRDIAYKEKLVNDGGVLDNENLKRFKKKLNPIEIKVRWGRRQYE